MKLGILILQYNSIEYTEALCKQIPEAIVIDNGSERKVNVPNEVIRLDHNYGFTIGWIKGIETVYDRFDAFWLMNNDISIERNSIERVKRLVDSGYDFFTPTYNGWAKEFHKMEGCELRDVGMIEFCAPIITKKVFETIGMFDPAFILGYGVEGDFCYRARKAGFKIYVDDGSEFYHYGHKTTADLLGHTLKEHEDVANKEHYAVMEKKYGNNWRSLIWKDVKLTSDINKPIVVYTTIFGDYCSLKEIPEQNISTRNICITDNPHLACKGWEMKVVDFPRKDLHPRMRAKYFKLLPFEAFDSEISVFIDGSIQINRVDFIEHCIRNLKNDFLLYKHPERISIQDEIKISRRLKKYDNEPMELQVNNYLNSGYKDDLGLFACGVMVRRHTPEIKKIMLDWWDENIKWTYQDQLSLPYVLWKNNYLPNTFNENQVNEYFSIFWNDDGKQPINVSIIKKPDQIQSKPTGKIDYYQWDGAEYKSELYKRVERNYGITEDSIKRFGLIIQKKSLT